MEERRSRDCKEAQPEMNSVLQVADCQFHRPPVTQCLCVEGGASMRLEEMQGCSEQVCGLEYLREK